ncbi:Uncharacterised protein [Klebsiella pneumoniae]|uniref:Uncharacterized protein n=1 Tax=Klebsiella pneumoniae TaxID=573 RepID=A0A378F7P9_KLEPN|nr:Uncharacterised protein [Klebsiella pneumoniae]
MDGTADVKQGEQQLSDPVRLFQMRIAGKDKAIDTQRGVFIDPFGNGGGIAHQRRSRRRRALNPRQPTGWG